MSFRHPFRAARLAALGLIAPLALLAAPHEARAQFATTQAAATVGGACTSGTYAWPSSGGQPLTCVSSVWQAVSDTVWSVSGSNIYYTGGNVGIGTTSPSYKLEIDTNAATQLALHQTGSGSYAQMVFMRSSDGAARGGIAYDNTNDLMYLGNYISPVLSWNQSGNVGIGTTSPVAMLQVGGGRGTGTSVSTIGLLNGSSAGGIVYPLTVSNTATTTLGNEAQITFADCVTCSATGAIGNVETNSSSGASDLRFLAFTGSALNEMMRIQGSTGNVGIGNSSPTNGLLEIADTATQIYLDGGTSGVSLTNSNAPNGNFGSALSINIGNTLMFRRERNVTGNINIDATGGNTFELGSNSWTTTPSNISVYAPWAAGTNIAGANFILGGGLATGNATPGAILFQTTAIGSSGAGRQSYSERMRIDTTGNVGIGTTSPSTKLHISGGTLEVDSSGNTVAPILLRDTNNSNYAYNIDNGYPSAGIFGIRDSGGTRLAINAGNVGIGTTSPQATLDVNGAMMTECVTVATLPTGKKGMRHCVTDATSCTFMATLTGSGSTVCPAFYNGSAWVAE